MPHLNTKKFFTVCIILVSQFAFITALSKSPIKYGKPDIEDLRMQTYSPDSTAEAVILCNYGYFKGDRLEFVQTIRIKILKKGGTHWGNRSYFSMGNNTNVRGITYNLENGEVVESKLKKESIFRKQTYKNAYTINVAMPNVKVGSVIDIEVMSNGLPREWRFQELIPVRRSELNIEESSYIKYQTNFFGYLSLDLHTKNHYKATDVSAFKIEPYMDSYKNYISKLEFDLKLISYPGFYEEFATSWEEVGSTLMESKYFGDIINSGSGYLKEIAEKIENTCSNDLEKLKMAYESIKIVKWNDIQSNMASTTSLSTIFKKKIGNSADINFLLIKLLDRLKIETYPVVLSTRDNGQLSRIMPSLNKLNYTICCAIINGEKILMDPTEEKLPLGLLPERTINTSGRIIYSKEKTDWIDLSTIKKNDEKTYHKLKLNADFSITGIRIISYYDYRAFEKREELEKFNSNDEYLANLESKFNGFQILKSEIKNEKDIYNKVVETLDIKLINNVDQIDNLLMLNLNLLDQVKENQFRLDERIYPVNYPCCISRANSVQLQLPEGYHINELPQPIKLKLPENAGIFYLNYTKQGNTIILNSKLEIKKKIFLPNEYPVLKEFFTLIVKKHAEPIILMKS